MQEFDWLGVSERWTGFHTITINIAKKMNLVYRTLYSDIIRWVNC